MEILRKISFSSSKSESTSVTEPEPNAYRLEEQDQDKIEELNRNFTHRDAETFAPQLVKDMKWEKFNERILDYGCGTGRTGFNHILPPIYLHDSHLYSVDTSESLVSYATMKYPHPTVTYAVGDIMSEHFPFKYTQFDKIFSLNVLQCVRDYKNALTRFFETLKPGGHLGFTMATNYFCEFLDRTFSKDDKWQEYFEDWIEKSKETDPCVEYNESFQHFLHAVLSEIGFEVEKIKTENMEWTFPSLEKAVVLYMATSPYVKNIPAELQEPFEDDCLDIMMKKFNINSLTDPYDSKYDCVYVVVKKPGVIAKPVKSKPRIRYLSLP